MSEYQTFVKKYFDAHKSSGKKATTLMREAAAAWKSRHHKKKGKGVFGTLLGSVLGPLLPF